MGFIKPVIQTGTFALEAKQSHDSAKSIRRFNDAQAELQQAQANQLITKTQSDMRQQRRQANAVLAQQENMQAASQLAPLGTPDYVQTDLASQLENEIQETAHQALSQVQNLNYSAQLNRMQGEMARAQARGQTLVQGTKKIGNAIL